MKCPACEFIFFDGRDICPKCMLDLRSYKKSLGMKVTNPNTPYKELVKQRLNSGAVRMASTTNNNPNVSNNPPQQVEKAPPPSKPFWGYLNGVAQKLLDRGGSSNQSTPASKSEESMLLEEVLKPTQSQPTPAKTASVTPTNKPVTTKPAFTTPPTSETTIIDSKRNSYELAKEIEKITASVTQGPKVLDFSDGDDTVEEIIFELSGTIEDEK